MVPRYFFDIEGAAFPADRDGTLLAGPDQARSEAVSMMGEMLRDIEGEFWEGPDWRMLVTDEQGATVCTLSVTGATDGR